MRWGPMSRSSATDFTCEARAVCGADRWMQRAITVWPWRLRLRHSAPSHHPSSAVPTRSPSPTPSSSQRWHRCATHKALLKTDKIYLVGFMAAGKTTLAQALSRRLGWRADDVDLLIEARERRTVADIFAREGEPYFRSIERQVIWSLLPLRHAIIATGGGTFVDPENRAAINADGVSVWIDVPFDVLLERIPADGRRPLANDRVQMALLYETRRLAYQQAQLRLDATRARSEELVEQLIDQLE